MGARAAVPSTYPYFYRRPELRGSHEKTTRSLVFIQYKKLDRQGRYRPDKQFTDQLRRLAQVQALGSPPSSVGAWRLGKHSAWVKLATPGPFDSEFGGMIKGQYVPLDYLQMLLQDDSTLGKNGGRVLGYETIGKLVGDLPRVAPDETHEFALEPVLAAAGDNTA